MYLPHFFCGKDDYTLLKSLTSDLEKHSSTGMINWCEGGMRCGCLHCVRRSQHLKHENPTFSPTFQSIVKRLEECADHVLHIDSLSVLMLASDTSMWMCLQPD